MVSSQVAVPAVALAATLALLTLVIPGNSPSYQPSTAALNVAPSPGGGGDPAYANVAPILGYKADGVDSSVDLRGLPGLLECGVPAVNLSIAGSVLDVAAAAALPDEFGFIASSDSSPPPAADLARLSTAMLSTASQLAGSMYGALAFTNNGSLLSGQNTGAIVMGDNGTAE